jgi:hypothetical protein
MTAHWLNFMKKDGSFSNIRNPSAPFVATLKSRLSQTLPLCKTTLEPSLLSETIPKSSLSAVYGTGTSHLT